MTSELFPQTVGLWTVNLDRTKKSRTAWGESPELSRATDYTVGISTLLAILAHHASLVPRGGNVDRRVATCCSKCPALSEALSQPQSRNVAICSDQRYYCIAWIRVIISLHRLKSNWQQQDSISNFVVFWSSFERPHRQLLRAFAVPQQHALFDDNRQLEPASSVLATGQLEKAFWIH